MRSEQSRFYGARKRRQSVIGTNSFRFWVLFGTNYPMLTPQACLEKLPEPSLDAEQSELFL